MLDSHPTLSIPPATHFVPRLLRLQDGQNGLQERSLSTIITTDRWSDLHIPTKELDKVLRDAEPNTISDAIRVVYRTCAAHVGKPRWGDKTPRYPNNMPRIAHALPEAHFDHIIRDGRDVAVSGRYLWFSPGADMGSQGHRWTNRSRGLGSRRRRSTTTWSSATRTSSSTRNEPCGRSVGSSTFPTQRRCSTTMRPALNAPGVEDIPGADGKTVTGPQRRSLHEKTAHPPDPNRIRRWRRELDRKELEEFERAAGDLLDKLGYGVKT